MEHSVSAEFIRQSIKRMGQSTEKITDCAQRLNDQELWYAPNNNLNSVGNLMLHLCGNIRQHIISGLGNIRDERERDLEFSVKGGYTREELIAKLRDTAGRAEEVIAGLEQADLLKVRINQGMPHSGIDSILHVTEHYSYHTGQIIFLTKLMKDVDLGFYAGIDLNKRNEG